MKLSVAYRPSVPASASPYRGYRRLQTVCDKRYPPYRGYRRLQTVCDKRCPPYRLLDAQGHEMAWVNDFLDAGRLRQQSPRSLRAYA